MCAKSCQYLVRRDLMDFNFYCLRLSGLKTIIKVSLQGGILRVNFFSFKIRSVQLAGNIPNTDVTRLFFTSFRVSTKKLYI